MWYFDAMSRSPFEEPFEFAPNPGVPLPEIKKEIFDQTYNKTKEQSRSFWEGENRVLWRENSALAKWSANFRLGTERTGLVQLQGIVLYRLLRKQAESTAMTDDPEMYEKPLLPRVLGDEENDPNPEIALPFQRASNQEFISQVLNMIADDNPALYNWITERADASVPDTRALICGMYWLLKYHSKPREEN